MNTFKDEDLFVIDNLFTPKTIKRIEKYLRQSHWHCGETADPKGKGPKHWVAELSAEEAEIRLLLSGFYKALERFGKLALYRVYCNGHMASDCPLPHQDSRRPLDRTVLYYANSQWSHSFAGETVFFNNGEIVRSVIPKPGRIVIFNSSIEHCARVQTKLAPELRLTVAFKFWKK